MRTTGEKQLQDGPSVAVYVQPPNGLPHCVYVPDWSAGLRPPSAIPVLRVVLCVTKGNSLLLVVTRGLKQLTDIWSYTRFGVSPHNTAAFKRQVDSADAEAMCTGR